MDWTDDRLQERFDSIDRRFGEVNRRLDQLERNIRDMRSDITQRLDDLHRAMVYGVVVLSGSFIAGFAALIGLVATQL